MGQRWAENCELIKSCYSTRTLYAETLMGIYRLNSINDPLAYMRDAIDWSVFPELLKDLYHNDTEQGGRPNIPVITMVRVLFLESMYNLVDEQTEQAMKDRTSFMNFLGFPEHLPDFTTIWIFRERLSKTGRDRIIWNKLHRQIESRGNKGQERICAGCHIHNGRSRS